MSAPMKMSSEANMMKKPNSLLKRRRHLAKSNGKLKRFKLDVSELTDSAGGETENVEKSAKYKNMKKLFKSSNPKARKERRKQERALKKAHKRAYSQHKRFVEAVKLKPKRVEEEEVRLAKEMAKKLKLKEKKKKQRQNKKIRLKKEEEEERKKDLEEETNRDAKLIRQLEKQMKMNKKKTKSLPKSFMDDGLDYLMDVIDKEKVKNLYEDTDAESDAESDRDHGSDDEIMEELQEEICQDVKQESEEDDSSEGIGSDGEVYTDSDDYGANDEVHSSHEVDHPTISVKKQSADNPESGLKSAMLSKKGKSEKKVMWKDESLAPLEETFGSDDGDEVNEGQISDGKTSEDIYGRLRDERGNVVDATPTGSYVPPAKRMQLAGYDEKKRLQLERVKRQMKGLINRVSDTNMQAISSQIEDIFLSHSRAEMSESLTSVILDSCLSSALTPERLTMELMMLLTILHHNIGSEVGAFFIQTLAQHFVKLYDSEVTADDNSVTYGSGKEIDNVVILFSQLYNFKVIHSNLILDVFQKFADKFKEKDIEILLLMLKNVGFTLRKDEPVALKDLILKIQSKATAVNTEQSRVKFMLEVLTAIKNNNMRKIPNYDPEHLANLKKTIKQFIKGSSLGCNQLNIGLSELSNAENRGRWWLVGAAWDGRPDASQPTSIKGKETPVAAVGEVSSKLIDLARKQRMNTDTRKNIFYILMTSEDCIDAFEKLLRLGLKNQQEREIVHVIVDCCLQERKFNLYYGYLIQKFCEYDRRFEMTFQFHMWDKFKEMSSISENNRQHLGSLLTHLIVTKAISLSILKVLEFGTLDKFMVRLLKQVLSDILLKYPESTCKEVFKRIATISKLKTLHEGLALFVHHFLAKRKKDVPLDPVLVERIGLVDKILSASRSLL